MDSGLCFNFNNRSYKPISDVVDADRYSFSKGEIDGDGCAVGFEKKSESAKFWEYY